ncbi:MAG: hypothetical protein ACLPHP_11020 [Candidatus Sulfotelmatobacter sp.]
MATKKKNKKKATTSKKGATKKSKLAKKRATLKKPTKKKAAPRKAVAKAKTLQGTASGKAASPGISETLKKRPSRSSRAFSRDAFSRDTTEPLSGSGDLQGLSRIESADSESVDELADEGNAFEAGVVAGVEDAGERGNREVRTREVPEDDVPEEYLDKD